MKRKNNHLKIVVGLGKTGLSIIKYLLKNNRIEEIAAIDSRKTPPLLKYFLTNFPPITYQLGDLDHRFLSQATELLMSPGVSLEEPSIKKCMAQGIKITGDIELFSRATQKPIIAITGSNGKSTVVTLVGEILKNHGFQVGIGGNLGTPALELLQQNNECYVLELSSFQLETITSLGAKVAAVLNISEDHMDRYPTMQKYGATKLRIYDNAKIKIVNLDDPQITFPNHTPGTTISFSIANPNADFYVLENHLAHRSKKLLAIDDLKIRGMHNVKNALAAMAICKAMDIPDATMVATLCSFTGLPHRCQWIRTKADVSWYNDSKATNVGATKAAIEGLGINISGKKIILIAGGLGKGADFSPLATALIKHVKLIILLGQDATLIHATLASSGNFLYADSMAMAVNLANCNARAGDLVLLSPACASLDMFHNFEHRGDTFINEVNKL